MATFYEEMQQTAIELIDEFGMDGAIIRQTKSGDANDVTITSTRIPCRLVEMDYEQSERDGTNITAKDTRFYVSVAGVSVEVSDQDKIEAASVVYDVIQARRLRPAGLTLYWNVQARV